MPLKIKLPLDTRKQTLSCQNCPYKTKNKTQFEVHGRECGRVGEERLKGDVSKGEGHKVEDDGGIGMVNGSKVENGCNGADESELSIDEGSSVNGEESTDHKVVVRHYTCKSCGFQTTTSKTFLFHQRDDHQADFDIFPCDICDYASKWKCKVIRHREMIHRSAPHMAMQDYPKLKSPHRVFGKPGPKMDGKPRKTPLSMVPTPEMIPMPKIKNLKEGLDEIMPLMQLNGSSLVGEKKKKKGVKRKLGQEETAPAKKRVTDGRSQPRSYFLQFIELCSTDGQEPRYKCKLCFYSNLSKWQIRQHIKARHVNAKSFTCNIGKCTFSTYKKAEFFAHKTKHNQVTFECKECEYVTFLKPNLDRHRLNHGMLGVPYKCSLCSYASAKEAAVMRHIQEHHLAKEKQVVTLDGQPVQRSKPRSKKKPKGVKLPTTATDAVNNGITSPPDMKQTSLETFYTQLRDAVDGQSVASKESYDTDGCYDKYKEPPSVISDYNDVGREEGAQKEDLSDVIGDTAFMCPECGFAANSVAKLDKHMSTHGYNMEGNEVEKPEQTQTPEPKAFEHKSEEQKPQRFPEEVMGQYNGEGIVGKSAAEYFEMNGTDSEFSTGNFRASDNSFSEDQASVDCPSAEQNALVSTNGDVVCSICGYVAVTMTRLKGHMVSHSNDFKYTCDLCPRKYKRSSDLNYHMKKAHNIRLRDYLQGSKEQDEPLNLSMRSNTSNDSSIDTDMPEPMDFIEDGPLPEDNDFRDQPLDLSHHAGMDEEELIGADMQCPQCPYVAKWPSDMRRHQLVHTGDRRYQCRLCPRSYKWQGDLNVHMKKCHDQVEKSVSPVPPPPAPLLKTFHTHNKARKGVAGEYHCRYCNYVAKYTSELMRHTRIHTHEKPYRCTFCPYDTAWKGDLKRHIEKHHADRLPDEKAIYNILQDIEREVTESYCSDYLPQESDATSVISDDSEPLAASTPQKMALLADRREKEFIPEVFYKKHAETKQDAADPCLCKICGWRAPMPSKLHMHLVAHDNIKVYKCTICGFRTNWVWDTRKHVRAKHGLSDPGPYCLKMNETEARASIAAYLETRERPGRTMSLINNNNNNEKEWMPIKPILDVPIKLEKDVGNVGMKSTSPHHGYARPFKCSACPRRSNWKWELKKHIKLVHEGQAQIVILSREEALATLPPGLTPGMKLNIGDNVKVPEKPKPTILKTPSAASVSALFHSPSEKPLPITIPPSTPSPAKSFISVVSTPSPSVSGKGSNQVDHDKSKKFKCSSCPYRSNYRSDVQRHVYNKHRKAGEVVILDKEAALATLQDYLDTFPGKKFMGRSKRLKLEKQMQGLNTGNGAEDLEKWKCNKCEFHHADRDAVIEHLSQHSSPKVQLYCCKICPYSSEMCSTVRRHIRSIHELPDEGNFFLNEVEEHPAITFGKAESKVEKVTGMFKLEPDEDVELPPGEGFVEKRFRCKHCGARSNWKNAMYRHIREVHNLTSYNLIEELTEGPDGLVSIPHVPRREAPAMVLPYKSPDSFATKAMESFAGQQDMLLNMSYGVGMAMNGDHSWNEEQNNAWERSGSDGGQDEGQNDWDKEPADSIGGKKGSNDKQGGSNERHSESNAGQGGACGGPNEQGKGESGASGGQDGDGKKPDGDGKKKGKKKKKKKKKKGEKGKKNKEKKEKKDSRQQTLDELTFIKIKDKSGAPDKKMEQGKSESKKELVKILKSKIPHETKGEIYKEGKIYKCSICPYKTVKSQNVLIHQRNHVKRPGHDVKCPHCPYYVALPRFLKQHMKCHSARNEVTEKLPKEMKPSQQEMEVDKTSHVPMEIGNGECGNIFHVEVVKPGLSNDKEEVVRIEVEKPTKRSKAKGSTQVVETQDKPTQELNADVEKTAKCKKSGIAAVEKPAKRSKAKESTQVVETQDKPTQELNADVEKTAKCKKSGIAAVEKPAKRSKAKESSLFAGTPETITQESNTEVEKPAKSKKSGDDDNTFVSDFNRKMYNCSMCPYFSKSKADMLYHKQFHRKRALVKYKCQHCDYWAMHKRVISQHEKLHDPTWRINRLETLKQLLVKDSEKKAAPQVVAPPSVQSSPAKSEVSERSYYADYDPVDIASIKQEMILSKITAVPLSMLPPEGEEEEELAKKLEDSPKKVPEVQEPDPETEADEAVIDIETVDSPAPEAEAQEESDVVVSSIDPKKKKKIILVKKLHRCRHCPYTNIRGTNLRLHEKMHGFREDERLVKCPKCDYHVGNKGLLTHHLKVHANNYQPEFIEPDIVDEEIGDGDKQEEVLQPPSSEGPFAPKQDGVQFVVKYDDMLEEHIIHPTIFKKYSCEKCPYGTSKRSQYEKHFLLHGSKQKFTCEFCDYSVPLNSLLVQHKKLHLMPNQNLLAVQSISNLRSLPELPADVAVAMVADVDQVPQDPIAKYSGTHDHLELFENGMEYEEPKKLYRCDRCPFTNVHRDHLLTHLKCHMIRSDLQCPYCDFSVSKEHLLTQHVKVHFGPLTVEEEIIFNGENRAKANQENGIDLSKNGNLGLLKPDAKTTEIVTGKVEEKEPDVPEKMPVPVPREAGERPHLTDPKGDNTTDEWRCRYCDRMFPASSSLIKHEMQHLIGCHF